MSIFSRTLSLEAGSHKHGHDQPRQRKPNSDIKALIVGAFRITPSHLARIGGLPIAAQFPPEAGGGYLGFMEVLHQLHCVVSFISLARNLGTLGEFGAGNTHKRQLLIYFGTGSSRISFGNTSTKTTTLPAATLSKTRKMFF